MFNVDFSNPGAVYALAALINAAKAAGEDVYAVVHNLFVKNVTNEQLNAVLAKAEELAKADAADARNRIQSE